MEQRNPYRGVQPRAWIVVRLKNPSGVIQEFKLIADTGNPCSIIIAETVLPQFTFGQSTDLNSNFGYLRSSWFLLAIPELGFESLILGYGSNEVAAAAQINHSDFAGLAGLPLLRLLEYGGNEVEFWIRRRSR